MCNVGLSCLVFWLGLDTVEGFVDGSGDGMGVWGGCWYPYSLLKTPLRWLSSLFRSAEHMELALLQRVVMMPVLTFGGWFEKGIYILARMAGFAIDSDKYVKERNLKDGFFLQSKFKALRLVV